MSSSPGTRPSSGSIFAWIVAAVVLVGLAILLILNGQAVLRSFFPPDPKTTQGHEIYDLYTIVFAIAAVIFFLVEGLIVWTVLRYRRKPGDDELPPQTHGHNLAEVIWTVVPTIIVFFLFFISWQTLNSVEAHTPKPNLIVRAVAAQFQWAFAYLPEGAAPDAKPLFTVSVPVGADGGLTLPAGQTTHLYVSSPDVIHAFYVPQFLFKRDVIPGVNNQFDLTLDASDAGQTFRGQCAELCGIGHRAMLFEVHALAPAEFEAWYQGKLTEASASPSPAPSGAAPSGAAPSGPAPSGGAAGPTLDLVAQNVAFDKTDLSAAASAPFTIHFDNRDTGINHDVDILDGSGKKVFDGKDFPGPAAQDYGVGPLPAGSYKFECSIHPTSMFGTLTVQ
jgi:cytochrome c oxidase subunit II